MGKVVNHLGLTALRLLLMLILAADDDVPHMPHLLPPLLILLLQGYRHHLFVVLRDPMPRGARLPHHARQLSIPMLHHPYHDNQVQRVTADILPTLMGQATAAQKTLPLPLVRVGHHQAALQMHPLQPNPFFPMLTWRYLKLVMKHPLAR